MCRGVTAHVTVGEAVFRLARAANPTDFGVELKLVSAWGQADLRVLNQSLAGHSFCNTMPEKTHAGPGRHQASP
jgi:hypothetical protein